MKIQRHKSDKHMNSQLMKEKEPILILCNHMSKGPSINLMAGKLESIASRSKIFEITMNLNLPPRK